MKKRPFSLLEMMISLSLLAFLLGTLFYWYSTLSRQKGELDRTMAPLLEERYAKQRLSAILSKIEQPFFSSGDSLVFIFDRGPCLEPKLSSGVLARLYFDRDQKKLCLGVWPKPEKEKAEQLPCETTTLLDGVENCSFNFYFPPDPFQLSVSPEEVAKPAPREGWQSAWQAEFKKLPAIIRIVIKRDRSKGIEDHEVEYLFDLHATPLFVKEGYSL